MRTEYIEIDENYLNKHKTKKGAWTRNQLLAIGVEWPLVSGWKERVIGTTISPEQQMIFEDNNSYSKPDIKLRRAIKLCESRGYIVIEKPRDKRLTISGD